MKPLFAIVCAALLIGAAPHPSVPHLSLHIQRNSLDLLDTIAIAVVLDNTGSTPVPVRFALPSEYVIDVLHDKTTIWSSLPSKPPTASFPIHTRSLLPGTNTLAIYDWNEVARDGTSPGPGAYLVRVRLLDVGAQPVATTSVRFVAPTPISAIAKLPIGDAITVAGHLDALRGILTDATGSTKLPQRLLRAPLDAPVAVRGTITTDRSGARYLTIIRWAPMSAP